MTSEEKMAQYMLNQSWDWDVQRKRRTERVAPNVAFSAIHDLYRNANKKVLPPELCLFVPSPFAAALAVWYLENSKKGIKKTISRLRNRNLYQEFQEHFSESWPMEKMFKYFSKLQWCYGSDSEEFFHMFLHWKLHPCHQNLITVYTMLRVIETCGWFLPYSEMLVISDRPTISNLAGDPLLVYSDGFTIPKQNVYFPLASSQKF